MKKILFKIFDKIADMTGYDYHIHQRVYDRKQLIEYRSKKEVSGLMLRAGLDDDLVENVKKAIASDMVGMLYKDGHLFYRSDDSLVSDNVEITGTLYVYKIKP